MTAESGSTLVPRLRDIRVDPTDLVEALRLRNRCIEVLATFEAIAQAEDISATQWFALGLVDASSVRSPADLARDLRHDPGAMTRLLDGLERRALITRRRSTEDRRLVRVELTDAGRVVVDRLRRTLTVRVGRS